MSFVNNVVEFFSRAWSVGDDRFDAWMQRSFAEGEDFLNTGSLAKTEDAHEIEAAMRKAFGEDLAELTAAYQYDVERAVAYIRAADIDESEVINIIEAAKKGLNQESMKALQDLRELVEGRDKCRARVRNLQSRERGDPVDPEVWKQGQRQILMVFGADFALNSFNFFASDQIASGYMGSAAVAALVAGVFVGSGWFIGDLSADWKPGRRAPVIFGGVLVAIIVSLLAALYRNGGQLVIDLPTGSLFLFGLLIFGHSLVTRLRLPKLSDARVDAYVSVQTAERASSNLLEHTVKRMAAFAGIQQDRLEAIQGNRDPGSQPSFLVRNKTVLTTAKSALEAVVRRTEQYETEFRSAIVAMEEQLKQRRDNFLTVVGGLRDAPAWVESKPDLSKYFQPEPAPVADLKSSVGALTAAHDTAAKHANTAVNTIGGLLERAVLEFRKRATAILTANHFNDHSLLEQSPGDIIDGDVS